MHYRRYYLREHHYSKRNSIRLQNSLTVQTTPSARAPPDGAATHYHRILSLNQRSPNRSHPKKKQKDGGKSGATGNASNKNSTRTAKLNRDNEKTIANGPQPTITRSVRGKTAGRPGSKQKPPPSGAPSARGKRCGQKRKHEKQDDNVHGPGARKRSKKAAASRK